MGMANRPRRNPRLLGMHKTLSQVALVILFLLYWHFALRLEQLDYTPRLFESLISILELFGVIFRVPIYLINTFGGYFSLRVLRHLIPPIIGWIFARQAILGMLQSFYDLSDSDAAASLLYRLSASRLGLVRPAIVNLQTFKQASKTEPVLKIGGPGRVAVFRDAALVTEINGRFARVLGPGRHDLARFEFPRTLIDLRPQERESHDVKMMTSDGIELTTSLTVTFQIFRGEQRPTKQKPFPFDEEAVRKAAYLGTNQPDGSTGEWDSLPMLITSGQLRTIVAEDRLDDLILSEANGIDVHRRLQMEMERRAKAIMLGFGVMIRGTRLGALELPEEVEAQRKKYWEAHWDKQRTIQMAEGEAEVLQSMEIARAEAEAVMLQAIAEGLQRAQRAGRNVSSREVVALRLIESLEAMAKNSEKVLPLPDRLIPQLGSLRQQLMLTSSTSEEAANQE
jgi:regulator of protease activity HflC (stomatin/prohibitin superfamily)